MLKEEHRKGAHQDRGQFPGDPTWITLVRDVLEGLGQQIAEGVEG